jgi:hypothetical protein
VAAPARTKRQPVTGYAAGSGDPDDLRRPRVRQRSSHAGLITDLSARPPRSGRTRPLDALIVPAARHPETLRAAAGLAAAADVKLVVLASRDCRVAEAARVVADILGGRALIAGIPDGYQSDLLSFRTSAPSFDELKAGRSSDLSLKRNLGLLLARLMGWQKIMFLDDDIFGVTPTDLAKVASQLDYHQVAGLISRSFPDNSVVCHANRLRGGKQDNFVTGAALGVSCARADLDFFPDIYNEDWLFFAEDAARGEVISIGEARQRPYKPFADPRRAEVEEFGDLIAEGIYALFNDGEPLNAATAAYWAEFIAARKELIGSLIGDLYCMEDRGARVLAHESMLRARKQLQAITKDHCVSFVNAWRDDREAFARMARGLPRLGNYMAACEYLGLSEWREAEFAQPDARRSRQTWVPQPARA